MPLFRIMMKPVPPYPAECWAECDKPEEIAPLIAEMRSQFGLEMSWDGIGEWRG